ncbi:uncharacterized protein EV422DRAFT_619151 [Fimicolochytrium jonesii]|uniref:uncharacterized protein n=1 Tax=Fimicolochytrium jonesii TaxID=1396493 RepID=UPI0022FF078B|nr:uncharacterized protein EV422DRAFT_619151 [Fimicolochytrium jonesii]KAI8821974.1 hypothetical protein EV422DRAFT_619151 [Fimicolochytrium jonesii]
MGLTSWKPVLERHRPGIVEKWRALQAELPKIEAHYIYFLNKLSPYLLSRIKKRAKELRVPSISQAEFGNLVADDSFASNITATWDDFANKFHRDNDTSKLTYGIWFPVSNTTGKLKRQMGSPVMVESLRFLDPPVRAAVSGTGAILLPTAIANYQTNGEVSAAAHAAADIKVVPPDKAIEAATAAAAGPTVINDTIRPMQNAKNRRGMLNGDAGYAAYTGSTEPKAISSSHNYHSRTSRASFNGARNGPTGSAGRTSARDGVQFRPHRTTPAPQRIPIPIAIPIAIPIPIPDRGCRAPTSFGYYRSYNE